MTGPEPPEPDAHGLLEVGDGHRVYWEAVGDPDGVPALMVHGGPGTGCSPRMRQALDSHYHAVLFDQRGCGRSTPHASDPSTSLARNTTWDLVADMERLREHLGIERWLLIGGSWGSTLLLAYAQRHPERVSHIVISQVTTSRRVEIDWLYRGAARFFPEAWQRFRAGVPEADQDGDLITAYAALMEHPAREVRLRAARDWCDWEDAVVSLDPGGKRTFYSDRSEAAALAFVRICTHYLAHDAWLADDELLRGAGRLAGIPGALIHGRLDLSCPVDTAWQLARAWPAAELTVVDDAGHQGSDSKRRALRAALDRFAKQ